MKARLLKKIRKRFSVEYYPYLNSEYKYQLKDRNHTECYSMSNISFTYTNKQECLGTMMYIIRIEYSKYRRFTKQGKLYTKVWP